MGTKADRSGFSPPKTMIWSNNCVETIERSRPSRLRARSPLATGSSLGLDSHRVHRTFEIIFTLVFGSLEQALATSRRLHRRHAGISGHLPETLGPYVEGSPYLANDVPALMWVHATLVETALGIHDLVLEPLGTEPRARYYADCQLLGVLFGIPLEAQPPDWPAFARYFEAMVVSEELTVGAAAREIGKRVLAGAGRVPIPRWYRNVTAHLMPERLRASFGLAFGEEERRSALRALHLPAGLPRSANAASLR